MKLNQGIALLLPTVLCSKHVCSIEMQSLQKESAICNAEGHPAGVDEILVLPVGWVSKKGSKKQMVIYLIMTITIKVRIKFVYIVINSCI